MLRTPLAEWPDEVNKAFENINQDMYVAMQGPSEFGASGLLEFWDITDQLSTITIPTLVIAGTHDTMDPNHKEWMANEFPNGEFLLCPDGSHMSMWDDTDTYINGVLNFISKVEEN